MSVLREYSDIVTALVTQVFEWEILFDVFSFLLSCAYLLLLLWVLALKMADNSP